MYPNTKFTDVVKHGNYIHIDHSYGCDNVKCNRCYKTNIYNYITFEGVNLCMQCVDCITRPNINPKPIIPLMTMHTNIYNPGYINNINNINNNINNNIKINKFKIIDRISTNDFKVLVNNNTLVMHYKEIMDKYWDHLSFCDKEFFIQFD
jgi:hypothetical protein